MIIRRCGLSKEVLRFEARIGVAAAAVMVVFIAGCAVWVVDGGPGPDGLFHSRHAIDAAGLVLLALAFALAQRSAARTWRAVSRS